MKSILFQGDSITDGGRVRGNEIMTGIGYPTLVKSALGFDSPNQYIMYNRGIGGNRIVDLYARIKVDTINLEPDIMSILIGVNDVWHEINDKNGVDADKFYKVYCMMIEEIKAALPDVKIMLLEPFVLRGPDTEAHWDEFYSEVLKRAQKTKEVAEKFNLPFIPLQNKFEEAAKVGGNNYWLSDGVHPTAAGHELIKREWLKYFAEL